MRSFHWAPLCVLISLALGAGSLAAEPDTAAPQRARAEAQIAWKLPHQFDEALAEARAKRRLLIIKGVSFGIDAKGAACATAGKW